MESHLPAFKESNPQLEVVTELIRGQHPHLKGFYSKTLSSLSLKIVLDAVWFMIYEILDLNHYLVLSLSFLGNDPFFK